MGGQPAVLLLDDELVAISAHIGTNWPTFTPTVVRGEGAGTNSTIRNGLISLQRRHLVIGEPVPKLIDEIASIVDQVVGGQAVLGVFIGSAELVMASAFSSTVHHRGDMKWVTEVITPVGAHYLSEVTEDQCVQEVAGLVDRTMAGDLQGELTMPAYAGNPLYLYVMSGAGVEPVRVARACEGVLETGEGSREGIQFEARTMMGRDVVAFVVNGPGSESSIQ